MNDRGIIGGKTEYARSNRDFYPTPADVTNALYDLLAQEGLIDKQAVIWEPACGDGAMSKVLAARGHNVFSSDIRTDSGYGWGGA